MNGNEVDDLLNLNGGYAKQFQDKRVRRSKQQQMQIMSSENAKPYSNNGVVAVANTHVRTRILNVNDGNGNYSGMEKKKTISTTESKSLCECWCFNTMRGRVNY